MATSIVNGYPLAIEHGGSGTSDVIYHSDSSTGSGAVILASKDSGVTINYCRVASWGPVVMLYLSFVATSALSGTTVIATLKSDYTPRLIAAGSCPDQADLLCWIRTNGEIVAKGSVTVTGNARQLIFTYIHGES